MVLRRWIGQRDVLLECDGHFEQAGRSLLGRLAKADRRGPSLADGTTIQFGWSVLTLRAEGGDLRVYEPDYYGDALHALNRNLDTTFEVVTEQAEILRRAGVDGLDARFDQYVVAWPEAFLAPDIFLRRQTSEGADNSGWFIGDLGSLEAGVAHGDLEATRVFAILRLRRNAMQVLALPPGYTVIMRGATIDAILTH